ncbi:MAG: hypothetical protein AB2693_34370 [Candidatus Thiodiazotropha sp.]
MGDEFNALDHHLVLARLAELGDTESFVALELAKMTDFGVIDRWAFENGLSDHPAVREKLLSIAFDFGIVDAEKI